MISLLVLGHCDLIDGQGRPILAVVAQPKRSALLTYLALARPAGMQRRDLVIAMFWPDSSEERARNSLNQALSVLRRSVPGVIVTRGAEEVGIDHGALETDALEFEAALAAGREAQALALYKGDLLPGFNLSEVPEFERWLDTERGRLRARAVDAASSLTRRALLAGDMAAAKEWAARATALAPDDEQVLRDTLDILDKTGDRAGAVRVYEDFARQLRCDYQTEPSPETRALVDRIRSRTIIETHRNDREPISSNPRSEVEEAGPLQSSAGQPLPSAEKAEQSSPTVDGQPRRKSRRTALAVLALAAVAIAGAAVAVTSGRGTGFVPGRVLVAPFENQTSDTALASVGEMLGEWVTLGLSRTGLLDVVDDRTGIRGRLADSSRSLAASAERVAALARETGAVTVIRGSYYLAHDSLVVITQILRRDARSIVRVLAPVSAPAADPRAVVEKVRQEVLGWFAALSDSRLTAWATSASQPPTYAAYTEYAAGLAPWAAGDRRSALQHFERAYALDSDFVDLLPWLIEGLTETSNRARADSLTAALEARRDFLAPYDQALVDQQHAWLKGDREAMFDATRRMVRLAPSSPDANWLHGWAAVTTNHFVEAIEAFDRVEAGDGWTKKATFASLAWPSLTRHLQGDYSAELALVRRYRQRFPRDAEACAWEMRALAALVPRGTLDQRFAECVTLAPDSEPEWPAGVRLHLAAELRTHGFPGEASRFAKAAVDWYREQQHRQPDARRWREGLATALLQAGEWAEAERLFEQELPLLVNGRPPRFAGNAGVAAVRRGDTAIAEQMLRRLAIDTVSAYFNVQRARVLASLGRSDQAVDELRKAIVRGLSAAELFHADIGLEPLHGYRPYETLVRPRR